MPETSKLLDSVLNWVRAGYPQGVPPKDYYPVLALLTRTLSEDEVVQAARAVLLQGDEPVTVEQIQDAIRQVAEKEPTEEEMHQVAARLASVGWPLAGVR
ncbi:MAG: DUF3349 domain-containing protein [Mycobacterium sp.]|nr:DUF3349 domain-containing protein [Mycobacterium sp.]